MTAASRLRVVIGRTRLAAVTESMRTVVVDEVASQKEAPRAGRCDFLFRAAIRARNAGT